jgi:DNA helicase II / ATP-dependent DNA helicase PcrA
VLGDLDTLNVPQREAVMHLSGPLLVFAGAGSGKTRVITYRIANLVANGNVPPYKILAVTFTNKAAGEMRNRLAQILGPLASDLWVGTFHATCAKLLRRHGTAIGVPPQFLIYDASDQKAIMTRVLKELELDERRYAPRAVLARIHKEKQEGRGPEEMSLDSYFDEAIQKVYVKYQKALESCGALDFEDIILKALKLAESDTEDGAAIRRKFSHVLVDEFQDTNASQYRLLRAFTQGHTNLCVVGDDDQSIYRWRGADVRNIRGFRTDYADARVVKLEQNYRSTQAIVAAALGVIAKSTTREPKELWTANPPGEAIMVVTASDERDEAASVIRGIQEARSSGVSLKHVAVFYRVHAQSRVLEEGLRSVNIPYQIVGGMKFYERAEVKDAISYLRLLVNPASDMDLLRIINVPARGLGKTTIAFKAAL